MTAPSKDRSLLDRWIDRWDDWREAHSIDVGGMTRRDREQWCSACTHADLGDLMARWLEGDLHSQPGYNLGRPCGPDPETTILVALLARINRAGFVTVGSQPGARHGDDTQHASVDGYCAEATARDLWDVTRGTGLCMSCAPVVGRTRVWGRRDLPVPLFSDEMPEPHDWHPNRRDASLQWDTIGPAAWEAVISGWHVTIVDADSERNDRLWPMLDRFAGDRGA